MEYSELIIITGVALKRTCSSAHYNIYIGARACVGGGSPMYNIAWKRNNKS